jgi:DNA-directed RNA polymerase beta' subunit
MNDIIKEIKDLQFGVLSSEDILKLSVCEVNNSKLTSQPGTVYDERMGSINMRDCVTCGLDAKKCPGHFGHIVLNEYIIHPLFYKYVVLFLKCFCVKCFRMLLKKENLQLNNLLKIKGEARFKSIVKVIEKLDVCNHCLYPQPKITMIVNDGKNNIISNFTIGKEVKKVVKTPTDIKNIFDNILDEDITLLGLNPRDIHPKSLITNVIPVLPPRSRPRVSADNNLCDDDLTIQYSEIIKKNNKLIADNFDDPTKRRKEFDKMYFKIKSLFDNSQGKAKHSNGRSIKGIKERISGKEGIIRMNLLGKRVNQSSRTVIGPDPTLKMGEVAIPEMVAAQLTIPETVNVHNIHKLEKLINIDNKANFYIRKGTDKRINLKYALSQRGTEVYQGDEVIRKGKSIKVDCNNFLLQPGDQLFRDGEKVNNLKFPGKKTIKLNIGDVVERQLQNGDYVLLNRQPTLHIGSIISHKVVIRPYNTFRFNLATAATFNADENLN